MSIAEIAPGQERFTIGEVSDITGVTASTLRFYEQEGLFFAPITRNAAGRRVFTRDDVGWLQVCQKLRSSGMPLPEIRRYAALVLAGTGNEAERLGILRAHEERVRAQVADLEAALDVIHYKVEIYGRHLESGTADELWTKGPSC